MKKTNLQAYSNFENNENYKSIYHNEKIKYPIAKVSRKIIYNMVVGGHPRIKRPSVNPTTSNKRPKAHMQWSRRMD
jgi:hypothetical protein